VRICWVFTAQLGIVFPGRGRNLATSTYLVSIWFMAVVWLALLVVLLCFRLGSGHRASPYPLPLHLLVGGMWTHELQRYRYHPVAFHEHHGLHGPFDGVRDWQINLGGILCPVFASSLRSHPDGRAGGEPVARNSFWWRCSPTAPLWASLCCWTCPVWCVHGLACVKSPPQYDRITGRDCL